MLCKRCVLPESKLNIWFNKEGVCNICLDFEKQGASLCAKELRPGLIKVIDNIIG